MKAKKVVKRLSKVEALLSDVIQQFSATKEGLGELLDSAKSAVARARASVTSKLSTDGVKKQSVTKKAPAAEKTSKKAPVTAKAPEKAPVVTAKTARRNALTAAGRKKISIAAKKRWAVAKRKGVNAVTGRPLGKTA